MVAMRGGGGGGECASIVPGNSARENFTVIQLL